MLAGMWHQCEATYLLSRNKAMIEIGMKPMEPILSATHDIATAPHKLDQLGTLEKGKIADLVVVDADPLQDINNLRKISLVMKEDRSSIATGCRSRKS